MEFKYDLNEIMSQARECDLSDNVSSKDEEAYILRGIRISAKENGEVSFHATYLEFGRAEDYMTIPSVGLLEILKRGWTCGCMMFLKSRLETKLENLIASVGDNERAKRLKRKIHNLDVRYGRRPQKME